MNNGNPRYYEFGEFRLDARRRVLLKNGVQTSLTTRVCDLLILLIENEGRVLEHDEILDKVWEGTFVEQSNLKKSVSTLRQILGEQPNESLYIKTIPRRGYSFVAPVRFFEDDETDASGAFYLRETDTEIIIEEEIIEEDELTEKKVLGQKPPTLLNRIGSHKILFFAGIAVLLVVGVLSLRFILRKTPVSFSADNVRIIKLTSDGKIFAGDVSEDGNYLVYITKDSEGMASLWVKQIATNGTTRIVKPLKAAFYSFVFTPDGNYVYYTLDNFEDPAQNGIYKVPSIGGASVRITDKGLVKGFTLDKKQMLFFYSHTDTGQTAIMIADVDGSNQREIAVFDADCRLWSLQPSPDSVNLLVAYRRQYQDKLTFRVVEIPISSTPETLVMHDIIPEQEKAIRTVMWLPDKASLIVAVRETNAEIVQLWQYFLASGEWKRVTNDNNFYAGIDFLKNGKAFVTTQTINLTAVQVTENGLLTDFKQIGSGTGFYLDAEWLKDGRILYSDIENQRETISVMAPDGSTSQTLTSGIDGIRLYPAVGADEKFISFISARSGRMQAWRMDLDGKNPVQLTDSSGYVSRARVLSDGQTVIYIAEVKSKGWVLLKQTPDGKTVELAADSADFLDLSPDEKSFATLVSSKKTAKLSLIIGSIENGAVIKSFDVPLTSVLPKFTPDGKNISYVTAVNGMPEVFLQSLDGGEPKQLTNFRSDRINSFDWSPDGKNLLVVRSKSLNDAVMIETESEKTSK